jgi:hypothetical protein
MTALHYWQRNAVDGRAVIARHIPRIGETEGDPRLWLCRIRDAVIACDDTAPSEDGLDDGFLLRVPDDAPIDAIESDWLRHRRSIIARWEAKRHPQMSGLFTVS